MSSPRAEGRALCVVGDLALRRTLRRALGATGSPVDFEDELAGDAQSPLVFVDGDARRASMPELERIIAAGGKVVILGESIDDDELVEALRTRPLDNVISDVATPDPVELVVTAVKLTGGDIFGLEKYLSWGVAVRECEVSSYVDKREALRVVSQDARRLGARRAIVARIESVTDELLMNALYDAPAVSRGTSARERIRAAMRESDAAERAMLRYACDGRYFALSVTDRFGELHKDVILDSLARARRDRGRPQTEDASSGAGLGLYFILSSVTRFIVNIEPSKRSEVICLFDLRQSGRQAAGCARSLHVFTSGEAA